jgi:predicted glycosyltransferase
MTYRRSNRYNPFMANDPRAILVVDVLPFGLFMEIEGTVNSIRAVERKLGLKGLRAEHSTYPQLAEKHGKLYDGLIEARF